MQRTCIAFGLSLLLSACATRGEVAQPLPTAFVAAPQTAHRLVVVLPGRSDDLASLQRRGIADIIQGAWPDADVLLTGLTMPYYQRREATRLLHDVVIAPARSRNDREVWLLGISLGGMGALLYEREHPGELDGMLLLSPYLGDSSIQREIRDAGGLARWNPGPTQPLAAATFQHELWRVPRQWVETPARAERVWLAYGASERFRRPIELMAPALPPEHVLRLPGHHGWSLWTPAVDELLRRASTSGSH